MEQSDVRQQGMADVVFVVRGYWNTKLELLTGNMQHWNSEGYNTDLTNFNVKYTLKLIWWNLRKYSDHSEYNMQSSVTDRYN